MDIVISNAHKYTPHYPIMMVVKFLMTATGTDLYEVFKGIADELFPFFRKKMANAIHYSKIHSKHKFKSFALYYVEN